ncbi:MAG TPA: hypothetical protein VGL94_17550 [Ktedonobacteraceae bacterium]
MEKTWDNSLSTLINSHPQAFLDLLLPGAVCLHHHRTKLSGTQRQPDAVLEVERYDEIFIFNPEFQSAQDKEMAERLLLYHMLLWSQFRRQDRTLPVRSCVVSLWKKAQVALSPLLWIQPGEPPGQQTERIRFSYETIKMWEIHHQVLLDLSHVVLYPLLPLTTGGATRKIVTCMLNLLSGEDHREFALIGYAFATRTFQLLKQSDDLEWLKERFRHMDDILRESPLYEWILEEGEAKGEAKGVAKGVAQMRQTIVDFVQECFPELVQLAEEVVATIDNLPQLGRLSIKLGGAQSAEQARKILLELAQ